MGNDKKNRDQKPKSLIRANVNAKIQSAKSAQNAQTPLKVNAKFQKVRRKFSRSRGRKSRQTVIQASVNEFQDRLKLFNVI